MLLYCQPLLIFKRIIRMENPYKMNGFIYCEEAKLAIANYASTMNKYDYSDKPDEWLYEIVAGDKPSSPRHVAAKQELAKRRATKKWYERPLFVTISSGVILLIIGAIFSYFWPKLFK